MKLQIFDTKVLYSIFLLLMTILFAVGYIQFNKKIERINKKIKTNEIQEVSEYSRKISKLLSPYIEKGLCETLKYDEETRKEIEDKMSMIKSSKYVNIFIIKKDDKGKLRYILDAETNLENRGEFWQKFDPQNDIWKKIFIEKIPQYDIQEDIKDLWITYLYPVKQKTGEVLSVIAFDFSINTHKEISNMLKPINKFLFYFILIVAILFILNLIQMYLQHITNQKSYIDPLTSTYNRYYLSKTEKNIVLDNYVVAMLDIDHFKSINDTYGHSTGDIVLQYFVKRIQNKLKKGDTLIRYGGEEFVLLLYKRDLETTKKILNRMKEAIGNHPMSIKGSLINVTSSFGVNTQPELSKNLLEAIQVADEQLYKAKNNGRNRVEYSHI